MRGINKAIIVGTLGRDPEVRYTAGGSTLVNLSVATNETWKDKHSGEAVEKTEWHRIVIFGKLADIAAQYLKKGSQVYLEGRIQTRKWQGSDGQDRYSTEILAQEMQMLGGRSDSPTNNNPCASAKAYQAASEGAPAAKNDGGDEFDDVPF